MRVLVLGTDTPLGQALIEVLAQLGRHETVTMSRAACRWKSERQAKKEVRRAACDMLVDIRVEAAADGSDPINEPDLKRCHWVAKACQRNNISYLYVSSSRVFSGERDRPYSESDMPDNRESVGELLQIAEQAILDSCERHFILRLGPVFSYEGNNIITDMLGHMMEGGSLVLDNNLRGCPVAAADGARVLSALLDQISTGMEPWGIYHYCSSDTATLYEFAEAILAAASQFSDFGSSAVQLERESAQQPSRNRALSCSKIRNTFAIKQVPWRSAIADLVKTYYQRQQ